MSIDRRDLLHSLLRSTAGGVIVAITTCASVGAHEFEAGKITVEDPWLRSPGDGETTAPLFMIIENKGDTPDKLIGARAAKVGKVVIHADPARIVVPHGIVIPPRATVTLEPGGPHVGLHDVTKMNPVGWGFELTLIFEKAGEVTIDASVEAPDAKHEHDAEATERWEKAHGAKKEAEPAAHEEHHDHADHEPMRITSICTKRMSMRPRNRPMSPAWTTASSITACSAARRRRRAATDRRFRRDGSLSGAVRAREGYAFSPRAAGGR